MTVADFELWIRAEVDISGQTCRSGVMDVCMEKQVDVLGKLRPLWRLSLTPDYSRP